jgi:hypothetical protein
MVVDGFCGIGYLLHESKGLLEVLKLKLFIKRIVFVLPHIYILSDGRQEATELELLEPLANSILQHWDFTVVKAEFGDLDKLFKPAYNVEYAY